MLCVCFSIFWLLCLAVNPVRGKEPTQGLKKKRGWKCSCLTRAFALITWRVTGEKPQGWSKLWQLYRKGETARVLGVYNRLQGTLEEWSLLTEPRRKQTLAEAGGRGGRGGRERVPEQNCRAPPVAVCLTFDGMSARRGFLGNQTWWPQREEALRG